MSEEVMKTGLVVWFDARKGFGFVKPDDGGDDVFVHYSNVRVDGFKTLKPDQKISYEIGTNHRGPQAVNVVVLSDPDEE